MLLNGQLKQFGNAILCCNGQRLGVKFKPIRLLYKRYIKNKEVTIKQ